MGGLDNPLETMQYQIILYKIVSQGFLKWKFFLQSRPHSLVVSDAHSKNKGSKLEIGH